RGNSADWCATPPAADPASRPGHQRPGSPAPGRGAKCPDAADPACGWLQILPARPGIFLSSSGYRFPPWGINVLLQNLVCLISIENPEPMMAIHQQENMLPVSQLA